MLVGVIYVHRISDTRFDRIDRIDITTSLELFSEPRLENFIIITNAWSEVSRDTGETHENRLSNSMILRKGARMVRHDNTTQSAHDIIRRITRGRSAALRIQREDVVDTEALEADNRRLNEQIRQYRAELEEVREETMHVLKGKDEEMVRALREKDEEMMQVLKEAEAAVAQALKEKDEEMM